VSRVKASGSTVQLIIEGLERSSGLVLWLMTKVPRIRKSGGIYPDPLGLVNENII
jgi:hypothetical protein